jgi:quinol monooxygenase YgiN
MLPVVAVIRAKEGKVQVLEQILKGLVKTTRQEKGCEQYDLHRNADDPREFVFVERWKSEADLRAHLATPHIAAAMRRKDELIERIDIKSLQVI